MVRLVPYFIVAVVESEVVVGWVQILVLCRDWLIVIVYQINVVFRN